MGRAADIARELGKTVADMAREHGLEPDIVHSRLRLGWTLDKALRTPVRERIRAVDADGNVTTYARLAAECGMSLSTLRNRLNNGWSLEDALSIPRRKHTSDYDAKYGLPISKWLAESGVTLSQFRSRIGHGWSPERAAREPLSLATVLTQYLREPDATRVRDLCVEHDVPLDVCVYRLRAGWEIDKACTVPVQRKKRRAKTAEED